MKCLGSFYIKERVTSGKIPARVPIKSSAVGSASCRKTWKTWSRKNLMKARKKIPAQTEMMCDKIRGHCNDIEILLSSRGAREENFNGLL